MTGTRRDRRAETAEEAAQRERDRVALEASLAGHGEHELFACDPALADTAAFCAAYGFDPADSANTIVVIGKSQPPVFAACVVLATHRLDVNRAVRDRLGTRKASFASADETRELTGMAIGGVTVFGGGATADRPGRRQSLLEGHRGALDPPDAAERRDRRRTREPGAAAAGGLTPFAEILRARI